MGNQLSARAKPAACFDAAAALYFKMLGAPSAPEANVQGLTPLAEQYLREDEDTTPLRAHRLPNMLEASPRSAMKEVARKNQPETKKAEAVAPTEAEATKEEPAEAEATKEEPPEEDEVSPFQEVCADDCLDPEAEASKEEIAGASEEEAAASSPEARFVAPAVPVVPLHQVLTEEEEPAQEEESDDEAGFLELIHSKAASSDAPKLKETGNGRSKKLSKKERKRLKAQTKQPDQEVPMRFPLRAAQNPTGEPAQNAEALPALEEDEDARPSIMEMTRVLTEEEEPAQEEELSSLEALPASEEDHEAEHTDEANAGIAETVPTEKDSETPVEGDMIIRCVARRNFDDLLSTWKEHSRDKNPLAPKRGLRGEIILPETGRGGR